MPHTVSFAVLLALATVWVAAASWEVDVDVAATSPKAECRTDWSGTYSFSPTRSFFTGSIVVTQHRCSVSASWWEHVTDWHCRGHWLTGWIETGRNYTALGQKITPLPAVSDDCSGSQFWRPSAMFLSADGQQANSTSETWTRALPPKAPPARLPACLRFGECAIGFRDGFGPTCCSGLVLQQNYTSACQLSKGEHGYPGAGLSCQKKDCLPMGKDCAIDREGCCAGLTCEDMGISGSMCT